MLLRHNRNIDIRWQPALAGIRVMLIALAVLDCRKIAACISRYSCNVTSDI